MFKKIILFVIIFIIQNNIYAQKPIPPSAGLVAYYPFTGNVGDSSGNGNHGILGGESSNPILTIDRFGNANSAYQFGGYFNKNWIKVPNSNSLSFNNQISISMWFKQCSFDGMNGWGQYVPNGYFMLMSKAGDGLGANPGIWCGTNTDATGKMNIFFNNTNSNILNFAGDTTMNCFDFCEWVHLAVVINNTSWKMYFNGKLIKHKTITTPDFTSANNQDLVFGRMLGSGTIWYPYNGVLDDVCVYNRALTDNEILSLKGNYNDPLNQNNIININTIEVTKPSCKTNNVTINATGYAGALTYSINGGISWQSSNSFLGLSNGTYTISIKNSCIQKDTILIFNALPISNSVIQTICEGESYLGYNSTGIYKDTLINLNGCDSIRTLKLTVNPKSYSTINQSICEGQLFLGYGSSGIYRDTFVNSNGCDSVRIINLFVNLKTNPVINQTICEGEIYLGYNTTGIYKDTLINSIGCDSIRILNLTVNQRTYSTLNQSICEGEIYLGYNTTGIYIDTLINKNGCDSVRKLILNVLPKRKTSIFKEICEGEKYFVQGSFQTTSGIYTDNFKAVNGCDSIVTTQLTVLLKPQLNLGNDIELCFGDSIILNAGTFDSYLWNNGSTQRFITINKQGIYWVQVTNISSCLSIDSVKVVPINCQKIEVPNVFSPNGDNINDTWEIKALDFFSSCKVNIFNRWGQLVFSSIGYKKPWNGMYNGKIVPIASYYYIIEIPEINQRLSGILTVLY